MRISKRTAVAWAAAWALGAALAAPAWAQTSWHRIGDAEDRRTRAELLAARHAACLHLAARAIDARGRTEFARCGTHEKTVEAFGAGPPNPAAAAYLAAMERGRDMLLQTRSVFYQPPADRDGTAHALDQWAGELARTVRPDRRERFFALGLRALEAVRTARSERID